MTLGEFLIEIGIRKNELSTIKSVMSPKNIKLLDYELAADGLKIVNIDVQHENEEIEVLT